METFFGNISKDIIMYQDELSREARLIALGHQEYVKSFAQRWQALLDWFWRE